MSEKTILFVEDEDSIRLTLRDYLIKKGYHVLVASDGVGAIKILLDHSVDLLLTDYRMDILGGDYWIKFLDKFLGDMKIIVTSGYLKPDFNVPFPVIFKPFEYSQIEETIAHVLQEG